MGNVDDHFDMYVYIIHNLAIAAEFQIRGSSGFSGSFRGQFGVTLMLCVSSVRAPEMAENGIFL